MDVKHGRGTAQDGETSQQQDESAQNETMTQHKEEPTQDELTAQRPDVIEAFDDEPDKEARESMSSTEASFNP